MKFDHNPFNGLYAPLIDVAPYLSRIGLKSAPDASVDGLALLMHAHAISVPFENLDVFHGHKEPCLSTEALYEKLVIKKRGGYCFELNGLFWRLLEALGFDASCCVARIAFHREYLAPSAHRIIVVSIDGTRYFCDIGFGGPVPTSPIPIYYDAVQTCAKGNRYRFTKEHDQTVIWIEQDDAFVPLLQFSEVPADPVDFIPLNAFCSRSEHEPFLHKQMIWRLTENGKVSIDGDVLRIVESGVTREEKLETETQLRQAFKLHFDLIYEGSLRNWRSKTITEPFQTVWHASGPPYSLHDMNVVAFDIQDRKLIMRTQSGMTKTKPPYEQINGSVVFCDVDYDMSYVYLLDHTGNVGSFTGRKIYLKDFILEEPVFGFSIMDENYGYHQAKYSGYLSMHRAFYECMVEIYHKGDLLFTAEETECSSCDSM